MRNEGFTMKPLIIISLLLAGCTTGKVQVSVTKPSAPAYGYEQMCEQSPTINVCGSTPLLDTQPITSQDIKQFTKIHHKVYDRFTYSTDMKQFKVLENWVYPTNNYDMTQYLTGDCEDFSFAVVKAAKDAGIRGIKMLFVVDTGKNIGHVVAMLGNRISDVNFGKTYSLNVAVVVNKYNVYKVFDVDTNKWYYATAQ